MLGTSRACSHLHRGSWLVPCHTKKATTPALKTAMPPAGCANPVAAPRSCAGVTGRTPGRSVG